MSKAAREGEQTDEFVRNRVSDMPSWKMRSICGVWALPPVHDKSPWLKSSARMISTFAGASWSLKAGLRDRQRQKRKRASGG